MPGEGGAMLNRQVLRVGAHEWGQSEQSHEGVAKGRSHDEIILFTLNIRRNLKKSSTEPKKILVRRGKPKLSHVPQRIPRQLSVPCRGLRAPNHPLTLNDV